MDIYEPLDYIPEPWTPTAPPAAAAPAKEIYEPLDYIPEPYVPPEPEPEKNPYLKEPGGSFFWEAPKGVAGGATTATGTAMQGLGGIRQEDMYRRKQEEAQVEALGDQGSPLSGGYTEITPETRQKITAARGAVPLPDITQDPFYKAGLATKDWSAETFAAAKDYENTWTRKIAEGLGSTIPFMAASLAGGGVGGALVVGGVLGSAMSSGEAIERAVQGGASKEQILEALKLGMLPGLTEQMPVEFMLNKIGDLPLPVVGRFVGVLGKILAKASAEGGQEAVQQALQNVIENFVYDPSQTYSEGVLESAIIGAAVGGIIGTPTSFGGKRGKADEETVDEAGTVQPEGVADTSQAVGQPSPGDINANAGAPPPGAPASVTTEASKEVVPAGAVVTTDVDPTLAAAAGGAPTVDVVTPPVAAKPTDAIVAEVKPGEVAGDVGAAIAAMSPAPDEEVVEDPDELAIYDYEPEDEETAIPEEAAPTDLVPAVQQENVPTQVTPQPKATTREQRLAAATAEGETSMLAAAEERARLLQERGIEPSEATQQRIGSAPPAVPAAPTISGVKTMDDAEAFIRSLVETPPAAPTQEPVQAAPAPGVPITGPTVKITPAAAPVASVPKPQPALAVRQVVDRILQDVAALSDPDLEGDMRTRAIVERVANRVVSQFQPGLAGGRLRDAIEAAAPAALNEVRDTLVQERVAEAQRGDIAQAESAQAARERLETGAGPELARRKKGKGVKGVTAAQLARKRGSRWWGELTKSEAKLPEAEQDKDVIELGRVRAERAEARQADEVTKLNALARALERRIEANVAARLEEEAKAEAAKPKPTRRKKEPLPPAPVPTTEEETPEAKEKREKAEAEAAESVRAGDIRAALEPVAAAIDTTGVSDRTTRTQLRAMAKTFITDFIANANEAVKATGRTLSDQVRFGEKSPNSPEENLLIWARTLSGRRELFAGQNATDMWQALKYLQGYRSGKKEDLDNLIATLTDRGDPNRSRQDVDKVLAAKEAEESIYENPSNAAFEADEDARPDVKPMAAGDKHGAVNADGNVDTSKPVPVGVIDPKTDQLVMVESARTTDAATALREVNKLVNRSRETRSAIATFIRNVIVRHLSRLVGDTPIHFVSAAEISRFTDNENSLGIYIPPRPSELRAGLKPPILIDVDQYNAGSAAAKAWVVLHEVTHAATSHALYNNIRGTDQVFKALRDGVEASLIRQYGQVPDIAKYAMTNAEEFLSEAFSNVEFQKLLMQLVVPTETLARVQGALRNERKVTTWWKLFTRAVANAISPFIAGNRATFMEQIIALAPQVFMSSEEQVANAKLPIDMRGHIPQLLGAEFAAHPMDVKPLIADARAAIEAKMAAGKHGVKDVWNKKGLWFRTTGNLKRLSEEVFDHGDKFFKDFASALQEMDPKQKEYAEAGDNLLVEMAQLKAKDARNFDKGAKVSHEMSMNQVDASVPLSHANNSHISKKGIRNRQQRAAHARLASEWNALPAEMQAAFKKAKDHYKSQADLQVQKITRNMVDYIVKPKDEGGLGHTLPAGETKQSVIDWVVNGEIDRVDPKDPAKPRARTARDNALHAALGGQAKQLQGAKELRKIKGWYVPLLRHGKHFFTARENLQTPQGAVRDQPDADDTHFLFANANDADAYLGTETRPTSTQIEWVDPVTGKITTKQAMKKANVAGGLSVPVSRIRVKVHDKVLEAHESPSQLEEIRKDYEANGFVAKDIAIFDRELYQTSGLLPEHLGTLNRSIDQSVTSPSVADTLKGGLASAYVRSLSGNRAQHRRLKRKRVQGYSNDFLSSMQQANNASAGMLAGLDMAPRIAEAERLVMKFVDDERQHGKGKTVPRQRMVNEIRRRIAAARSYDGNNGVDKFATAVTQISAVHNLFSPSYWIVNAQQGLNVTLPKLASRFGEARAGKEYTRALKDLGGHRTLVSGLTDTAGQIWNIFGKVPRPHLDFDTFTRAQMAVREPGYLDVMDRMKQLDLGASSGVEAPGIREIGKGRVGTFFSRVSGIALTITQSVEQVNRHSAALPAYRLAINEGMSHKDAVELAVDMVEQTQGGYSPANNPIAFNNKWLKIPLQYKKYPLMYAQAYYNALYRTLAWNTDPRARKQAAKHLAYLSAMTLVYAGVGGLAPMEFAKAFLFMAATLGLTDDDWEDWENNMQRFWGDSMQMLGAGKSTAEWFGEMMQRGFTRMLNIDLSNRMSNDTAILFGEPDSYSEADVKAWLFDMFGGAGTSMLGEVIKGVRTGEYLEALPFPKFMEDTVKAYNKSQEGLKTEAGRQYFKPYTASETALAIAGFKPRREAQQYELKGSGAAYRAEKKIMDARTKVIGMYTNAPRHKQQSVWRNEIQKWNRDNPKHRIDMSSLRRSISNRKREDERERRENR